MKEINRTKRRAIWGLASGVLVSLVAGLILVASLLKSVSSPQAHEGPAGIREILADIVSRVYEGVAPIRWVWPYSPDPSSFPTVNTSSFHLFLVLAALFWGAIRIRSSTRSLEQLREVQGEVQKSLLRDDSVNQLRPQRLEARRMELGKGSCRPEKGYDLFISHASEDKDDFVRPLAEALGKAGLRVWYDEFTLTIGDGLRRTVDSGLKNSRFGIVVLSGAFFKKEWPQYELDALVQREMLGGKVILPIWHRVSRDEVLVYSPALADKIALSTASESLGEIVEKIVRVLDNEA